ncbi:MAG: 4Fe-4S dicluster domain-containing protein [Planctomycetota bacterium]|jgi:Na(+)-translocating NADH:ubiquinone oxidoreductase A subunit
MGSISYKGKRLKIRGGYLPNLTGRPSGIVERIDLPEKLFIDLHRGGIDYNPVVNENQRVRFGDPIAEASVPGGKLGLPAPASGTVSLDSESGRGRIVLMVANADKTCDLYQHYRPQDITHDVMRDVLTRSGIWPFFWSSKTGGMPSLEDEEKPRAIIVNCVAAEPFRARGKVILHRNWDRVVKGIRFLPRFLQDYGSIEIILTAHRDPIARTMYVDLAGHAWVHFHTVPLLYPVENPLALTRALRRSDSSIKKEDTIWVIDVQGVEAIGTCLSQGFPLHQRVVALGGPGHAHPKHVSLRIGTPVTALVDMGGITGEVNILCGGLMKGVPVDRDVDAVQYDDDAFFFLLEPEKREFLSFIQLGFGKNSIVPCFASNFLRQPDKNISSLLRGERRPCIACGMCEKVCPAGLIPQMLHRYLYGDALDDAERLGLDLCVDCNLCSYVCVSKIELREQFAQAREQLRLERLEAEEASKENDQVEPQHGAFE